MSRPSLHDIARLRSQYTGEGSNRALDALRELRKLAPGSPPIPVANADQAMLEMELLRIVGDGFGVDETGWLPERNNPFGIRWMTPYSDHIKIGVESQALPSFINRVLPHCSDSDVESSGIAGLRARGRGKAVDLYRLGLPGLIRVVPERDTTWWQGVNAYLAEKPNGDKTYEQAVWLNHTTHMHPVEDETAHTYFPGYAADPSRWRSNDVAAMASLLLRRHLIFKSSPRPTGISLWMTGAIQLEWFDGPSHRAIVDLLTDPVFGLADATSRDPCTDCDQSCRFILLTGKHEFGVNLRRALLGATSTRRVREYRWGYRKRRLASLAAFRGARRLVPQAKLDIVLPPRPRLLPRSEPR